MRILGGPTASRQNCPSTTVEGSTTQSGLALPRLILHPWSRSLVRQVANRRPRTNSCGRPIAEKTTMMIITTYKRWKLSQCHRREQLSTSLPQYRPLTSAISSCSRSTTGSIRRTSTTRWLLRLLTPKANVTFRRRVEPAGAALSGLLALTTTRSA